MRRIQPPSPELKSSLKILAKELYQVYELAGIPNLVHGYVKGRSNITNALCHLNNQWISNIDIKNFFESITRGMFENPWHPRQELPREILDMVMPNDYLPVGYNTSPIVSNLFMLGFDRLMENTITNTITRYSDNITVSGLNKDGVEEDSQEVIANLNLMGFQINKRKTHLQKIESASITGITRSGITCKLKRKMRVAAHQRNLDSLRGINSYLSHVTTSLANYERENENQIY